MASTDTFQELVRRARQGDRHAMERLLERVRPHMEAVAKRYAEPAGATQSTSDLVQEASLRAWQKLDQFEGGMDDAETLAMFHGWIGQIVSRLASNWRRDQGSLKRSPAGVSLLSLERDASQGSSQSAGLGLAGSGASPSTLVRKDEEEQFVQAAMERIADPTDSLILRLRFFDGVSLRQIADRLRLDYNDVRDRYALALVRLEADLGSLG